MATRRRPSALLDSAAQHTDPHAPPSSPPSRREFILAGAAGALLGLLGARVARAYQPAAPKQPARLTGLLRLAGPHPGPPAKAKLSGDISYCKQFDLREEKLVVDARGEIRHAAVFLDGVTAGKPADGRPVELAEAHCTFVPHVVTITAGNQLLLINRDPVLNTFHAIDTSSGRTLFNVGLSRKDMQLKRRVRTPGIMRVLCDVHPWEEAFVVALPHPYHTVTDRRGTFAIDGIPPGNHTLVIWHETLGEKRVKLTLAPGEQKNLTVELKR